MLGAQIHLILEKLIENYQIPGILNNKDAYSGV